MHREHIVICLISITQVFGHHKIEVWWLKRFFKTVLSLQMLCAVHTTVLYIFLVDYAVKCSTQGASCQTLQFLVLVLPGKQGGCYPGPMLCFPLYLHFLPLIQIECWQFGDDSSVPSSLISCFSLQLLHCSLDIFFMHISRNPAMCEIDRSTAIGLHSVEYC